MLDEDDEPTPDRGAAARRYRFEDEDDDGAEEGGKRGKRGEGGEGDEWDAYGLWGRRVAAVGPAAARAGEGGERHTKDTKRDPRPAKKGHRKPPAPRRAPSSAQGDSEKVPLGPGACSATRVNASVQMTSIHAPSADDLD